jgi:hypothetical protein
MKRFLFGMTILALTALSTTAQAADQGVKLGMGGYYKNAFGVMVSEDDGASQPQAQNRRSDTLKQNIKLWFEGSTKLDNGLEVGAVIELFGQTIGGGQIDDTVMYVKGSFGELRVGDTDDARIIKAVVGPQASKVFAADHLVDETLSFSNNHLLQGLQSLHQIR